MKKTLRTAAFLAAAMISLSAAAQDEAPIISNYGYTNLTYGYGLPDKQGSIRYREEILVDGVMHVMWMQEGGMIDDRWGLYELWYRRSDDLGKTWSEPVCVSERCYNGVDETDKMMNVVGNNVYIVARDRSTNLWLYRSKAGGAFEGKELTPGDHNIDAFRSIVVGSQVAITYYEYSTSNTFCLYSADGESFTWDKIVDDSTPYANQCFLKDFAFDGKRMAMLYGHGDEVFMYVSDDLGRSWNRTLLSPTFKDDEDKDYCKGGVLSWWRNGGNSAHPVPMMALNGDKLYALFHTAIPDAAGQPSENNYAVVARSLDGGKTWEPLTTLTDDFQNYCGNLVVRGDNVYVKFECSDYQKHGVWHSHDGGATFELQNSWAPELGSQFNAYATDGEIYIDDNDPTGQTAYFLYNDYGYAKTTDGFRTITEIHTNAKRYTSDRFTHLLVDREGRRHWFVEQHFKDSSYNRCINYRREGDDPQPAAEDYALHLAGTDNWDAMNYITVPNTLETTYDREMTIEYWFRAGEKISFRIGNSWCGGASGYEGWRTNLYYSDWYGMHAIEFRLRNYDDKDVNLTSPNVEYNSWNHIACTYSASAGVAHLYLNGQLVDTEEMSGGLRIGRMPIMIGGDNPSDDLTIDDLRIWNRPLSPAEIAANYAAKGTATSFEGAKGLVLNYNFDQTLRDMSNSGRHAIPVGTMEFVGFDYSGIQSVTTDAIATGRTYDLQGREATPATKGVVVKDGRKEIVK